MPKRFMSIWFRYLKTDWLARRRPECKETSFVLVSTDHGRMVVTAANTLAIAQGVYTGMVLADARAIIPSLEVFDDETSRSTKVLTGLAEWMIRYSPVVSIDLPEGLMMDITGCAHLWGSEEQYLTDIRKRLNNFGYHNRIGIADTAGAAWAVVRYGKHEMIIKSGEQTAALLPLPPAALRLEAQTTERLEKLGLRQISSFIHMPRPSLRRRFGEDFLKKIDQALGNEEEVIQPVIPPALYFERLPCLEPIVTATGIEIALQRLLDGLCTRLKIEEKGLRVAVFKGYRLDGKIEKIKISTNRPSCNSRHLFKLFEDKISTIEPALGIELFLLEAPVVEELPHVQETLFEGNGGLQDIGIAELLDRISGKLGANNIHRYVPAEHYWPERSYKLAVTLDEELQTAWKVNTPRPLQLFASPEPVEVTAPVPDYPPMMFRYKGKLHKIIKADGPERIESEWWVQEGRHRDYYYVEDEEGHRYWLFRSGHYDAARSYKWFMHGFFA